MEKATNIGIEVDPRWEQLIELDQLKRALLTTLQMENLPLTSGLSMVVAGDEEMVRLNEAYRNEAYTTDVLSFPYTGETVDEMEGYLGDIVIGFEQALRQSRDEGHSVQEELVLLAVHGMLHLLGYDDESPGEKRQMWERQHQIMEALDLGHVAPLP